MVGVLLVFSAQFCDGSSSLRGAEQNSSFHFVCNRMVSHSLSNFFNTFSSLLSKNHHLVFPEPSCLLVLCFTAILLPTEVRFFRVALSYSTRCCAWQYAPYPPNAIHGPEHRLDPLIVARLCA